MRGILFLTLADPIYLSIYNDFFFSGICYQRVYLFVCLFVFTLLIKSSFGFLDSRLISPLRASPLAAAFLQSWLWVLSIPPVAHVSQAFVSHSLVKRIVYREEKFANNFSKIFLYFLFGCFSFFFSSFLSSFFFIN